jgi:hypothetical protein
MQISFHCIGRRAGIIETLLPEMERLRVATKAPCDVSLS